MKADVQEIAPDLFRLSIYMPQADLQFNHFLVRDEESLLFHTGLRALFPLVREGIAKVMNPADLRWLSFSHFEADECGSLNDWLAAAPHAQPVCGTVGTMVNVNDFARRKPLVLADNETLATGRHRFRFLATPHVPHGWDAGLLFEEADKTLFCSDLFLQNGNVEAVTENDLLGRARRSLLTYQAGPLRDAFPLTAATLPTLTRLSDLRPRCLATMHGSSYTGDGQAALNGLGELFLDILSPAPES